MSVRNRRRRERKRIETNRQDQEKDARSRPVEAWATMVRFQRPEITEEDALACGKVIRDFTIRFAGGDPDEPEPIT